MEKERRNIEQWNCKIKNCKKDAKTDKKTK